MIKFIFKELKQPILVILIFFGILFIIGFILHQQDKINYLNKKVLTKPNIVYVSKVDSTFINNIQQERDSLKRELFISNYKLARIREYVKLSENGSNYRYLGGWINRVLDNHDEF